jgi:SAM-dependent methyltransferase
MIESCAERLGYRHQLIKRKATMSSFDPTQCRRRQEAPRSKGIQRPASGDTQTSNALTDNFVECVLRHTQDHMPFSNGALSVVSMTHISIPGHHLPHVHHLSPGRAGHGPAPEHDADLAELLDLDAILGAAVLAQALSAAEVALGAPPARVVDLGAGTGTGTVAIATRFIGARIHSIDASPAMLHRLQLAAGAAAVSDRVETHCVDLDGDWPAVLPGSVDTVWAALSLHHVTDPAHVLSQAFETLRPGGVMVVTEFTDATNYEPSDLETGRAGLGPRVVSALAAHGYPVGAEWTTVLAVAGFAPIVRFEATFMASAEAESGARYLALQLAMNRSVVADSLPAEDLVALDSVAAALGSGASTVSVTSGRFIWVATRPEDELVDGDGS